MIEKIKYVKSYKNIAFKVKFLQSINASFDLTNSNYTTKFTYEDGTNETFITQPISKKTFVMHNLIVKDLKEREIDPENVLKKFGLEKESIYFDSRKNIIPFKADEILNIDLKNAYPTALYNFGFISESTSKALQSLDKTSKLAALGMLASNKTIVHYKKGEAFNISGMKNKWRNVFLMLVKYIDSCMNYISEVAGNDYVYFWVDGIYIKKTISEYNLNIIKHFINDEINFNYHLDILKDFSLKRKDNYLEIEFHKDSKLKKFKFPDKNINENVNKFISLLNLKNLNKTND